MIPKWRPVQVCCKGYLTSSNKTSCIPMCSNHCYHGQCVEPDVCKCDPGYGGVACSKCKPLTESVQSLMISIMKIDSVCLLLPNAL